MNNNIFFLQNSRFARIAASRGIERIKVKQEAARTYPLVGFSFNLVIIVAVVALLAVLVGGLPVAVAVVRSALARKRYGSLFLLIVPVLAFFAFLGVTLFLERLKGSGPHVGLFFGTLTVPTINTPLTNNDYSSHWRAN